MPTHEEVQEVLTEINRLRTERVVKPYWPEMTISERYAALEAIDWEGFSRQQELTVIARVLADEAPGLWMEGMEKKGEAQALAEEIRQDEHAARVRDYGEAATYDERTAMATSLRGDEHERSAPLSPITEAEMGEIEAGWSGAVREALMAETYRLHREIGYVAFRQRCFDDPAALREWLDPIAWGELRTFWDAQADYAAFRRANATVDDEALMRYRDELIVLNREPEDVQAEFYHRISSLGRAEPENGVRGLATEAERHEARPTSGLEYAVIGPEEELPLARVESQLREYKAAHAAPQRDKRLPDIVNGLLDTSWESGLTEAGKLRVLEGELEWSEVSDQAKEMMLAREVDFTKITRDQLSFVYEDIAFDHGRDVDERVARRLFESANQKPQHGLESPVERAKRQIDEDRSSHPSTQAGKLYRLESRVDWAGIGDKEKEAILEEAIDFKRITRDGLNNVYASLAGDIPDEIDERPARRLFDKANYAQAVANADLTPFGEQLQEVRPVTRNLIESVMLDAWPRNAAIVDFGLDSQRHYEAIYYPIRNDEIAPSVLDAAMGNGEKLTELARAAPSNPHKDIQFHTSWDELLGREPPGESRAGRTESSYERQLQKSAESGRSRIKDKDRTHDR